MSAVHWGVKFVGDAVDEADLEERQQSLLGKGSRAADEMFGQRVNAWRDTTRSREWLVYPVPVDPLKKHRYVVELARGRIVALQKVEKDADFKTDIPQALLLKQKIDGKTPEECERVLDFGRPLLTARSDKTGCLAQLYDAPLIEIEGLTKPRQCLLRFDEQDRCTELQLITVEASTRGD
jgi:hypothetical protein